MSPRCEVCGKRAKWPNAGNCLTCGKWSHVHCRCHGAVEPPKIKVGTFYDGRHVMAYTTWYNPEWKDCIVYEVGARNGTEAKKIATKMRKAHEQAAATALQKVVTR